MNGKIVAGGIVLTAALAGAAMWYLQLYGYYQPVEATAPAADMTLVSIETGAPEPMLSAGFEGIDADSSPLRFRGCFTTPMTLAMLTETYRVYDHPVPLTAPGWFSCFDANKIGDDLEAGTAVAFLSESDIHPGVDRVIAVYPDGHAYAWHQLNESADK